MIPTTREKSPRRERLSKKILDDVKPVWFDDEFLWWYTYITSSQVEEAEEVPGVSSVEFDAPLDEYLVVYSSASAGQEEGAAYESAVLAPRQEQKAETSGHMIFPNDPDNEGELATTEEALKTIIDEIEPVIIADEFTWWYAYLTDSQVDEAEKVPGVKGVEFDEPMDLDFVASPIPASLGHDSGELHEHGKRDFGHLI